MTELTRHSIVTTNPDAYEWKWRRENPERAKSFPIRFGDRVIYLGQIAEDPGHCAIATLEGEVVWILHPDEFIPLADPDITDADRAALARWLERVPGAPGRFQPLTIVRRRDRTVDWDERGRPGDAMLLYLGEGYPEDGRFAAATWVSGTLFRDDVDEFEAVPDEDR